MLFCGSDIAKSLGYDQPHKAIDRHCKNGTVRNVPHPQSPEKSMDMKFIPEGDIYRLITHSKLPGAEEFESWVFDEVLPTIRKTGGYVNNDDLFITTYLPFADDTTKMQIIRIDGQLSIENLKTSITSILIKDWKLTMKPISQNARIKLIT